MKLALKGETLQVWGEGKTSIEYLYVKDCVDAIENAIKNQIPSGIYNVGVNNSYSVLEIAELINKVCDNQSNIFIDRSKLEGGYHLQIDSSKFYKTAKWQPKWNLHDAISEMYELYKENK